MDILGFLAVLAAFGLAPRFGVDEAVLQVLRNAREQGRDAYERVRVLYGGLAVGPAQTMLVIAFLMQVVISGFGFIALEPGSPAWQATSWFPHVMTLFVAALMLLELIEAFAIGASKPRYRNVPRTNAQGEFLDAAGAVVPNQDQAAIMEELDRYPGYRPERFSLRRCLCYVVLTFLAIGVGWIYAGLLTESRFLVGLGAFSIYAALAAVRLMAGFLAWAVEKGAKLLEKVATVIVQQALVALPVITRENIEKHLPFGVNIIEEEAAAARIRDAATAVAVYITPYLLVLTVYPHTYTAIIAGAFLFVSAICGWYLSKNGGSLEVQNMRYRFARLMFYGLPALILALLIMRHLVPLLPEGFQAFWEAQVQGLLRFGSGQSGMGFLASWWQNLLIGMVTGVLFLIALSLALALRPRANESKPGAVHRGAFYALSTIAAIFLAVSLWSGAGLAANIAGKHEVRLPVVTSKTPSSTPAPAATAAVNKTPPPCPTCEDTKEKTQPAPQKSRPSAKPGRKPPPSRVASAEKDCDPVQITQDEAEFFTKFGARAP